MNEKINADLKALKFILIKNKSYILPVVVILISVLLFFQFVIPQFGVLFTTINQAKESSLKLQVLKENLNLLNNVNEQALDSQFQVLNSALPLDKDFIGILNSIYLSSQRTGVSLGSFSFKVGDLSKSENGDSLPVVKLSIPINASIAGINSFVQTLNMTLPLSEVYAIKVGGISSTIDLSFYYKPFDSSNYSQDVRVIPISQQGLTLIDQMSKFENASSVSQ